MNEATAITASGTSVTNDAPEAKQRAGDQRRDRGREAVEDLVEVAGEVGLDVEVREQEHQQEAREHESEAGGEPPEAPAADPPEVDAQLCRLGTGEHLVDGEGAPERLLGDPTLAIDALRLDQLDLRGRAAPGDRAEAQEPGEQRPRAVGRARPGVANGRRLSTTVRFSR